MTQRHRFDTIIVGAGSAGLAVAHALSHDRDVVVLEGGPLAAPSAATRRLTTLPLGGDRARRYAEARGRDVVRGRGLGGSAAVNGGYFLRGHRDDYADWPWPHERIAAGWRHRSWPGGSRWRAPRAASGVPPTRASCRGPPSGSATPRWPRRRG